ncbi:MAG: DNA gyrase subunit A, partial [Candidatus Krumholzibacteriia bacterium]
GTCDVLLATSGGMAIRFHETDSRSMGRTARGVRGISLREGQKLVGMVVIKPEDQGSALLSVTENGYGKRTPISDYRVQNRGGKGLITIKCSDRNGPLMGIRDVSPDEQLMVITRGGIIIRIAIDSISEQGRNTQGVRIIKFKDANDKVGSIAKISNAALADEVEASIEEGDADSAPADSAPADSAPVDSTPTVEGADAPEETPGDA